MKIFKRKSWRALKIIPLFIAVIAGLTLIVQNRLHVSAADVSSNFTITDAHAYKDEEMTSEISADNCTTHYASFRVKIDYKYESETPIAAGDSVSFPFANEEVTETTVQYSASATGWTTMKDSNGGKLGQWRINNKKIYINFSDEAIGKTSIQGTLVTPHNLKVNVQVPRDLVAPLTIKDRAIDINICRTPLDTHPYYDAFKGQSSNSNNKITWVLSPSVKTSEELYVGKGQTALSPSVKISNILIEDTLSEVTTDEPTVSFETPIWLPRHWSDGSEGISSNVNISLNSFFTKKTQTEGQSYEDFKNSLNDLEYGFYRDSGTNRITVVAKLGSQPSSITFKDALIARYGDDMDSVKKFIMKYKSIFGEDVADRLESINGESNIIHGALTNVRLYIGEFYPTSDIKTNVTNSATVTYDDESGNHIIKQVSADGNLTPAASVATVKGEAKVVLRDAATKLPIKGAKLKLQYLDGDTWKDVANGERTTADDGSVQVLSLDAGTTYRWVQTAYLDHYINGSYKLYSDVNLRNQITQFVMPSDSGHTSYATNEKESFTITYKPGGHGVFSDIVYEKQYYGVTTKQPAMDELLGEEGWIFSGWTPSVASTVSGDATYVAVWKKRTGTITTHHYVKDTTTEVAPDVVQTKDYFDEYTTSPLATMPAKYKDYEVVSNKPEGYTGTVKGDVTVTYYYQKKEPTLTSTITASAPSKVDSKTAPVDYTIKYESTIGDYIGDADITITAKLPYPIKESESDLDGGTYDAANQTITWTYKEENIDTFDAGAAKKIAKTLKPKLVYKGVKSVDTLNLIAQSSTVIEGKNQSKDDDTSTLIEASNIDKTEIKNPVTGDNDLAIYFISVGVLTSILASVFTIVRKRH